MALPNRRVPARDDYRRLLRDFAFPFFDERLGRRLSEVTPSDVAEFLGWLGDPRAMAELEHRHAVERYTARAEDEAKGKRPKPPEPLAADARRELSDSTIRNVLNPVRACFATAVREGKEQGRSRGSNRRSPDVFPESWGEGT